jgi:hypothetical protein
LLKTIKIRLIGDANKLKKYKDKFKKINKSKNNSLPKTKDKKLSIEEKDIVVNRPQTAKINTDRP